MSTNPGFSSLCLVAAAFAASACGGGGGVASDELEDEFERAVCEQQVACGAYPDLQTCLDTSVESSEFAQLLALLEAGRLDYDEDKAQECLDLFASANPDCSILGDPDLADRINEVCSSAFTGEAAEGEACSLDQECAGSAACELTECQGQCCTGTCVAVTPIAEAALGESCADAKCVSDAYCDADKICDGLVPVGGTCGDAFPPCVSGALCDHDVETSTGTCVEPPDEGESCDPELFLGAIRCLRIDNWCDPSDTICKKKIEVGGTCDAEVESCVDYAYCDAGTCTHRPVQGEACEVEIGPHCLGYLDCVNQVCVTRESEEPMICTDLAS